MSDSASNNKPEATRLLFCCPNCGREAFPCNFRFIHRTELLTVFGCCPTCTVTFVMSYDLFALKRQTLEKEIADEAAHPETAEPPFDDAA